MKLQPIITIELRSDPDVVLARQRGRQAAAALGFDLQDQTRIATATSEIARNAVQYARGGRIEFALQTAPAAMLRITISDSGPGIRDFDKVLAGSYHSRTGMGLGLLGAKRLMDFFDVRTAPGGGTTVVLGKLLPEQVAGKRYNLAKIAGELAAVSTGDPVSELQQQNQELLRTLEELRARQGELAQVNSELEDTNRGVLALYAELDDRAEYLRKASDIKSRFLSNISHELRTPLNSIVSLSRLLLDRVDGELTPEQEKQITYVKKSAEDLTELVNDLLDLAKVEAGKITVRAQGFEVSNLFSGLRGAIRPMLGQKPVDLIFEDVSGLPKLQTDEGKLSQILRNFISNAIKFTDKGEVRVSACVDGENAIVFSVADTGVGIAAEDQELIFQEWTQLENPAQRRTKGSGLGLPLSRKLADLLGGRIWLSSTLGAGSTFYLRVPTRYAGPSEGALIEQNRPEEAGTLPVLIVEDNIETLYIYEKFLQRSIFRVVSARNPAEARAALQETRPVAIVLDILLQNESGWVLLQELKSNPQTRTIPVLVATVVDNEHKARKLGADAFATKPVDRERLLKQLHSFLAQPRSGKLLIIDDDEVSRYVLKNALATSEIPLVEAASGEEGLRLARNELPRAIVLDLLMPGMSGFEVLRQLKSDPRTAGVPIVINTSKTLEPEERADLETQVAAIVQKDASYEKAAEIIQSVLQESGPRPPSPSRAA